MVTDMTENFQGGFLRVIAPIGASNGGFEYFKAGRIPPTTRPKQVHALTAGNVTLGGLTFSSTTAALLFAISAGNMTLGGLTMSSATAEQSSNSAAAIMRKKKRRYWMLQRLGRR